MKIGYLLQAGVPEIRARYLSGAANHVRQTFNELSNLGHHLCLLANFDGQIWKSIDLKQFEPVPVRWLDQGGFRKFEKIIRRIQADLRLPYLALFESLKFAQVCRQELSNFDLFYERMGWMGYGGGMASRLLGIPLIFEVNGDHLSEMEMLGVAPKGLQRYLSIALMKRAVRRTTHVVATGEGWRQQFINQWKYPSHKITVIENGSEVVNLLARDQLRSFQPHDKLTDPTIIYIGGFEPWHGVTILIRAFAKLIAEKVLAQLVLMGTGSELANIEQLIHNCALEEYVTLTGQLSVEQSAGYLAMSDIGVSPYCGRVEYSGLKLLDYKAAGLATIASGKDGQPALIRQGETGLIVPPCDEEALSEALIRLTQNTHLRRTMGVQARLEAERQHSWKHTAEQLDNLFNGVIKSWK